MVVKMEQQTIRIPLERNKYIKKKAESIGCSYNSYINILLDLGIKIYEAIDEIVKPTAQNPQNPKQ